jgi:hypothetical protein
MEIIDIISIAVIGVIVLGLVVCSIATGWVYEDGNAK